MLLLYDVGYVNEHEMVYVSIYDDDYIWCKFYEAKHYLWSPILFTWLCGVMELNMIIVLEDLGYIGKCFVC